MKKIISAFPILICYTCLAGAGPVNKDKFHLEMQGMIKMACVDGSEKRENMDSTSIGVYSESNTLICTYFTDRTGMCHFMLPLDLKYALVCHRKHYVSKIIHVDTRVPEEKMRNFHFSFDLEMFKEIRGLEVPELQLPIAHISYDISIDCFIPSDEDRTELVNRDIRKKYNTYFRKHPDAWKQEEPIPVSNTVAVDNRTFPEQRPLISHVKFDSTTLTRKETSCPENPSARIVYRVQVIALSKSATDGNRLISGYGPIYEFVSNGLYRYMVGDYNSLKPAQSALEEITRHGYSDAFLVAFINGERGTVGNVVVNFRK